MAAAVLAPTLFAGSGATQSPAAEEPVAAIPAAVMATDAPPRVVGAAVGATATLASGTPLLLMLDDELSTTTSKVGDRFGVTVLFDVYDLDRVVIPKGTTGYGEVTFATKKGGFGKPGILGMGYDLVWWGVIMLVVVETGMITPPFGMNLFVIRSLQPDVSLMTVFRGVLPFVLADFLRLALLVLFPVLVLWLPTTM